MLASLIQKTGLIEAPRIAVVQVEVPIGAKVLAREILAIQARNETRELLIRELLELFRCNRLTDS
jgi:hypothetical protein